MIHGQRETDHCQHLAKITVQKQNVFQNRLDRSSFEVGYKSIFDNDPIGWFQHGEKEGQNQRWLMMYTD